MAEIDVKEKIDIENVNGFKRNIIFVLFGPFSHDSAIITVLNIWIICYYYGYAIPIVLATFYILCTKSFTVRALRESIPVGCIYAGSFLIFTWSISRDNHELIIARTAVFIQLWRTLFYQSAIVLITITILPIAPLRRVFANTTSIPPWMYLLHRQMWPSYGSSEEKTGINWYHVDQILAWQKLLRDFDEGIVFKGNIKFLIIRIIMTCVIGSSVEVMEVDLLDCSRVVRVCTLENNTNALNVLLQCNGVEEMKYACTAYDNNGMTSIHAAAHLGRLEALEFFHQKVGISLEYPTRGHYSNNTCVHLAARNDHLKVLKYLKMNGCKLNSINGFGQTPFIISCIAGAMDSVKFLVSESFIGDNENEESHCNITDGIAVASCTNQLKVIKYLHNICGASLNKQVPWDEADDGGYLPLLKYPADIAFEARNMEVLMWILSHGGHIDVGHINR